MRKSLFCFLYALPVWAVGQLPSTLENASYRHYDRYLYSSGTFHTSVKPYLMDQVDTIVDLDTLFRIKTNSKLVDIAFNRSWVKMNKKDFWATADPYINGEVGKQDSSALTKISTRGFIVRAGIGNKVAVVSTFTENQAVYNDYRRQTITSLGVIPGDGNYKGFKSNGFDWGESRAVVSYSPSRHFNFQLGTGKNFWGDGYRSLFLSDVSPAYPFFKITTDFWHIKYVNLWGQFTDLKSEQISKEAGFNKKWGALHYLSWNAAKWLNFSLFEAVMWENADSAGYRGFDFSYANPVIFYRPVEFSNASPDNVLMGASTKITIMKNYILYGQVLIDEFYLKYLKKDQDWWSNKYALQLGYKIYNLLDIKNLDVQSEYNMARPFTYSHWTSLQCYGNFNQPLAHPLGANFNEAIIIGRYHFDRLFFEFKYILARYGTDSGAFNSGHNIFRSYTDGRRDQGNFVGQGVANKLTQIDANVSFLINPASNMNVAVGITRRENTVGTKVTKTNLVYVALRTSLENLSIDY